VRRRTFHHQFMKNRHKVLAINPGTRHIGAAARQPVVEKPVSTPKPASKPAPVPPEAVSEPIQSEIIEPKQEKPEKPTKQPRKETVPVPLRVVMPEIKPKVDPKVEREHRRLQHLIKKLAEQSGYHATIEQPTDDGQGRIDIGLQSDNKRIACEVSVTTPPDHELGNIRKCLASGYEQVILCSPDRKSLEKVKVLCLKELTEPEWQKVLFFEPDALTLFFEEEAARSAGKTKKIKGYKVNVNFQPKSELEKDTKRQTITQVLMKSAKRKNSNGE
jgi:hypothetical protein